MIIDGLNTFYRSYAVDPSMSTKGEHIGGLKGFLKQIQKLARENNPKEILIVWDGQGGSQRRKSINNNYKDGRKAVRAMNYNRIVDQELSEQEEKQNKYWQLGRLIEYLNQMPVKQFIRDNIEADDIISYLCQHSHYKNDYKLIVSNDKDFMQLLDDKTLLFRPATKKVYSRKNVLEEYGIHPMNMTIARAIVGDSSDNLPGVPGAGMKTVAKRFPLLSEASQVTLTSLFDEVKSAKKKIKLFESMLENEDVVRTNYKMMQLYSPYISAHICELIDEKIVDYDLNWNWHEIQQMMMHDGFSDWKWDEIQAQFNGMYKNFKELK
jgi:DNA polymerase-1